MSPTGSRSTAMSGLRGDVRDRRSPSPKVAQFPGRDPAGAISRSTTARALSYGPSSNSARAGRAPDVVRNHTVAGTGMPFSQARHRMLNSPSRCRARYPTTGRLCRPSLHVAGMIPTSAPTASIRYTTAPSKPALPLLMSSSLTRRIALVFDQGGEGLSNERLWRTFGGGVAEEDAVA